jgi:23S rRNA (cytidine2498-2'-O)-methyltransferase
MTLPRLDALFTAYLAPEGFVDELTTELGDAVRGVADHLVLAEGPPQNVIWCDNVWLDPRWIDVTSIGDAAQKLRDIQRNWWGYGYQLHRRGSLIQEKLPHISAKPLIFGDAVPSAPLGSWTLVSENLLLASPKCSSPVPNGEYIFDEDKNGPPNRAYLKLWEALTRIGRMPKAGETCLDLGASPGGWTWVLQSLGASVTSVDKAPLDDNIARLPRVTHLLQSAFALKPADVPPADWLFSDIICYPDRLLRLIKEFHASGRIKNFVCTIKFQGSTDFAAIKAFLEISGSGCMHLYNNKHEVTWFLLEKP